MKIWSLWRAIAFEYIHLAAKFHCFVILFNQTLCSAHYFNLSLEFLITKKISCLIQIQKEKKFLCLPLIWWSIPLMIWLIFYSILGVVLIFTSDTSESDNDNYAHWTHHNLNIFAAKALPITGNPVKNAQILLKTNNIEQQRLGY